MVVIRQNEDFKLKFKDVAVKFVEISQKIPTLDLSAFSVSAIP